MTAQDVEAAAEIEAENFSKPWTANGFLDAVNGENTLYLTAELDGVIVGYIGMWIALEEGEITNVSVKKEYQGRQIGARLMEMLEEQGKKRGVSAYFLEVRKSNERAVHLYQKSGFYEAGIRKNFYEAPREDAIIMCKR